MSNAWIEAVKVAMQRRQMSQRQLARETHVAPAYIANFLVGRQDAGFVPAQQIERVLGVPLDLWYASRGRVPDDLLEKFSDVELVEMFERMRKVAQYVE